MDKIYPKNNALWQFNTHNATHFKALLGANLSKTKNAGAMGSLITQIYSNCYLKEEEDLVLLQAFQAGIIIHPDRKITFLYRKLLKDIRIPAAKVQISEVSPPEWSKLGKDEAETLMIQETTFYKEGEHPQEQLRRGNF